MNQKFTTILWDVDDTLLDFGYSQRYALGKCFGSIGREITEEETALYARINNDYWKRLELGQISKKELLPGRFLTLFSALGIGGVNLEAFCQEYQDALGSVFSFLDDSLTICRKLQGCVKQYVISNGVAVTQYRKLKLSGLDKVMDGIFISEQVGYHKPDERFFVHCLKHIMEKDKGRILVVGDSLSSDIKGGIGAGLPTCWYNKDGIANNSSYKPDYEISCLSKIVDIVAGEGGA
ncbi:MAG: noncanonical pyrimidine nucleotidase, YjjG family [Lachnospiraceae bacterium]|nr:noncanonical pyrimidine nucleotidase, YjjG family [Lachnospiraceae bacterium]